MSISTVVRASGSPAAPQRSQKPDTMSVSDVPARPACVSHADNSAKKASFMPRLYSQLNGSVGDIARCRVEVRLSKQSRRSADIGFSLPLDLKN